MTWYIILLLFLVAIALLYIFLAFPRLPRRDLGALANHHYAHRGLWNTERPENSLPAFRAAVEHGFGIELDVHLTRDDHLVVFHDDTLERMCGVPGRVEDATLAELRTLRLKGTESLIPTFDEVLEAVGGNSPLIIEIKSDKRLGELCGRVNTRLQSYKGSYCIESFHPQAVKWFRKNAPAVIRGQLAYGIRRKIKKGQKNQPRDYLLASLCGNFLGRPDFVAYDEGSDRGIAMRLMRLLRPHLVVWTVRSPERMSQLKNTYDLQIFEGFVPKD